jgi:hypothetical protein
MPMAPTSGRRAGYVAGALANGVLLLLIHVWPGWDVVPFLTSDVTRVLGLVDLSLCTGIVVALAHLVRDPAWLTPAGTALTSAVGMAATLRMLTVFPFDVGPGWETVLRVLLVVGVVGASIGLLVALVSLVRLGAVSRAGAAGSAVTPDARTPAPPAARSGEPSTGRSPASARWHPGSDGRARGRGRT